MIYNSMNSRPRPEQPEAVVSWEHIHRQGMSIATRKARLDHEELEWMLTAERAGVHQQLGYSSFCQYLEFVFGYTTRDALARLQVAKRLAELPEVRAALRLGHQTWSGCRELSSVARRSRLRESQGVHRHQRGRRLLKRLQLEKLPRQSVDLEIE